MNRIHRISNNRCFTRNLHSLFKNQSFRTFSYNGASLKAIELLNTESCFKNSHFRRWNHIMIGPFTDASCAIFKEQTKLYSTSTIQSNVNKVTNEDINKKNWNFVKTEIFQATSIEDVLEVWNSSRQGVKIINAVLGKLLAMVEDDPSLQESILNNLAFAALGEYIQQNIGSLNQSGLTSALSFYTALDSVDLPETEALLNHIQWTASTMDLSCLCQVEAILQIHQESDLRQAVLQGVSDEIRKRWHTKTDSTASDIISMMYKVYDTKDKSHDTEKILKMNKLEKDSLEKCTEMNSNELYRVFYILSKQRRRNTPLLQALSSELNKYYFNFSIVKLANLAYACASLNYHDSQLLNKMSKNVLNKLSSISDDDVGLLPRLLHSFSQLRWRDVILIESVISTWLAAKNYDLENLSKSSDRDEFYDIFNSCAHLNHLSLSLVEYLNYSKHENFNTVANQLKGGYMEEQPVKWLNVVSSAGILGLLTEEMAESVLTSEFCDRITGNAVLDVQANKLLTVNACALCDLQDYKGPVLTEEFKEKNTIKAPKRKAGSAHKVLFSTFAVLAPTEKYIRTDTHTPLGHLIDFEVVVNNKGELQPLEGEHSEDFHRIAIQVLEFSHMTSKNVIGRVSLSRRHLQALGYKPLHVDASHFLSLANDVQRVQYIQTRINSVITKQNTKQSDTAQRATGNRSRTVLKNPRMDELLLEN